MEGRAALVLDIGRSRLDKDPIVGSPEAKVKHKLLWRDIVFLAGRAHTIYILWGGPRLIEVNALDF